MPFLVDGLPWALLLSATTTTTTGVEIGAFLLTNAAVKGGTSMPTTIGPMLTE